MIYIETDFAFSASVLKLTKIFKISLGVVYPFRPVHLLLSESHLLHFPHENVTGTRKFRGICCTFAAKT